MTGPEDHESDPAAPAGEPAPLEMAAEGSSVIERIRSASFATARRGYDRRQVDEFLSRLARRLESESSGFDPDSVKRRLQEVGESTTGILTAAEETARKLQANASTEAERLRRTAGETAEHMRSEAREFAESTRERATEEGRRLRVEATRKAEEVVSAAEARAEELLERSLERRRVLDATINRLLDRRAEIADRVREMADELRALADDDAETDRDVEPSEDLEDSARPRRDVPDFGFDDETSDHADPEYDRDRE